MAAYKEVNTIYIAAWQGDEDMQIMAMVKELASAARMPVKSWVKRFLLETLPSKIDEIQSQRKEKIA